MTSQWVLVDRAGTNTGYIDFIISSSAPQRLTVGDTFTVAGEYYLKSMDEHTLYLRMGYTLQSESTSEWYLPKVWAEEELENIGSLDIDLPKQTIIPFRFECVVTQEMVDASNEFDPHTPLRLYICVDCAGNDFYVQSEGSYPHIDLLTSRLAPQVTDVTFIDESGVNAQFGSFVQNLSNITVYMEVSLDPFVGLIQVKTRELTIGNLTFELDKDLSNIGTLDLSSAAEWSLTVTDNAGMSTTIRSSDEGYAPLPFVAYHMPSLQPYGTAPVVDRYKYVETELGETIRESADDGEYVRFNFVSDVSPVDSQNAWALYCKYREVGADDWTTMTLISEADGRAITGDGFTTEEIEALTFRSTTNWEFILWVEDTLFSTLETEPLSGSADKANAYFYVGKNGVAVGMRSSGKALDKRFEVSKEYTSHLYGGVETGVAERPIMPSGDTDEDSTKFISPFINNSETQALKLHRTGNLVTLTGAIKRTSKLASGGNANVFIVPEGYRPIGVYYGLMPGNAHTKWLMSIEQDGMYYVNLSRYGGTSNADVAATHVLMLSAQWITNDPFPIEDLI